MKAAEKDAEQRRQRREVEEIKLWAHVKTILPAMHNLQALSVNKPAKYDSETSSSRAFTEWLTAVRGTREEVKTLLRDAWILHKGVYGLPMATSTCGRISIQIDHVLTMLEHTFNQIEETYTTA